MLEVSNGAMLPMAEHVLLQVPDAPPSKDNKGNGAVKDKKNH